MGLEFSSTQCYDTTEYWSQVIETNHMASFLIYDLIHLAPVNASTAGSIAPARPKVLVAEG